MLNAISELDLFNFPCIGHTLQLRLKKAFDVPKVHTTLARVGKLHSGLFSQIPKIYVKIKRETKAVGFA